MSPEAYTAEAVQQAIAQGAITEAYQADPQQVIQELNRLRATEVTRSNTSSMPIWPSRSLRQASRTILKRTRR
jgi:apolipoprotein N-acyltransferase